MAFLIVCRFVQGIGAAVLQPLALANTTSVMPDERRGWAIGVFSTGGTAFLIFGPLIGAAILALGDWRWLFVLNLPVLAFAPSPLVAMAGALLWGAAGGVLDSTVKALVADLVPASRLATAYGVFAAVQGAAAIAGGVMAGALYERSLPILVAAVVVTQIIALVLLIATLRRHQKIRTEAASGAA